MDSTSYQTFEYITPDEPDSDSNQLYVVQDDGTYITLNRQVQYVTQVQDVNEILEGVEPCTVYDVTPQQFYVDNNTEFVQATDQFVLPDSGNNFYTQNFLLQQMANPPIEQMEQEVTEPITESLTQELVEENSASENNGDIAGCTEITLTDDQYQILEKKGWILLESNEKVYVLDNLGLHDITTNEKLIEKLKTEMQADEMLEEGTSNSNKSEAVSQSTENIQQLQVLTNDEGTFIIKGDLEEGLNQSNMNVKIIEAEEIEQTESIENTTDNLSNNELELEEDTNSISKSANEQNTDSASKAVPNSITIKTNYVFKDIPEKIFLGKTASGKNLVAKVVNKVVPSSNTDNADRITVKPKDTLEKKPVFFGYKSAKHLEINTGLSEAELESLITLAVNKRTPCNYDDRAAEVEPVIIQLLQVPSFKPAIMERNLIVTKISKKADRKENVTSEEKPTLVTGKLVLLNDGRPKFIPLPNVLQNLIAKSGSKERTNNSFTHIHISETKIDGGGVKNSIVINKKNIRTFDARKPPTLKFACSACASVFNSKQELEDHREMRCIDSDGDLTMDINVNDASYIKKNSDQNPPTYTCTLCSAEFSKLNNCQRHLKIHSHNNQGNPENEDSETQKSNKSNEKIYKCNMCSATFFNPTTLSRHILKRHIIKVISK